MRKLPDVLRLKYERLRSERDIAQSCGIARSTVGEYLRRFEAPGLSWPQAAALDEATLEQPLFAPLPRGRELTSPEPDWAQMHRELHRKGVTRFLLWQEYKAVHPQGYQYSQFCQRYQQWVGQVDVVMRQVHRGGEKLFVDYAGQTVPIVDRDSGAVREAEIFVAVLGASNYPYVEASGSQGLAEWIMAHVHALTFFGGCPAIIVPDNLKSGVHKACRYEQDLNPTYAEFAAYYDVAVLPARVQHPRDKAKVEVGVQVVERWLLARLRHQTFFSLVELNQTLQHGLVELNQRPFKKLPGCRRSLFEEVDRPALKPLPPTPYTFAEWRKARVNLDYHVEVDSSYYSVPYRLARQPVEVRLAATTVEVFHQHQRVASHPRSARKGQFSTLTAHMPATHQVYAQEWTAQRLISWAEQTGPATVHLIQAVLKARTPVQQGVRAWVGILRLGKSYGAERLEAAARRALALGTPSYRSLDSILKHGLDRQPVPAPVEEAGDTSPESPHENLRGAAYYH